MTSINTHNIDYKVNVNIWDTDPRTGRCGHASVTLVSANSANKLINYMGMWPKYGFLVTPFTLPFASPGLAMKSKKDCMEREGDDTPIKPTRVYQIPLTKEQYESMETTIEAQKTKIEEGKTLYSLFPNLNIVNFAKRIIKPTILEKLHACPFTELPMEHKAIIEDSQSIKELEVENCTTMAIKILNAGNIPVQTRYMPWGLSPTTLGHQLDSITK